MIGRGNEKRRRLVSFEIETKPWTSYPLDELERHYNPRADVPDAAERYDARRADANAAGLAWPGRLTDIAYGDGPLEKLDIYPPSRGAGPAPVHLFIHGGYWRARDKTNFAYLAAALARQGLMVVVINYPLCPAVTLDEVVGSVRDAFAWTVRSIANHGGDPNRITMSGHSAGGHLGAAILAHDWSSKGLGSQPLKGAVLVSGIYDPAPTQHISVNAEIGITPEIAERQNYARLAPKLRCPVHVIVGGGEPKGWIDQSVEYARHIRAAGMETELTITGQDNHFSIMDQFTDANADVMRAILRLDQS